jgi:hypothetical protein
VPRLYLKIRPGARYFHSLRLLQMVKERDPNQFTKSGIMVGLGETKEEVMQVMDDMRSAGVDFITIGQYLQPTRKHAAIDRFVTPDEFKAYEAIARAKGFLMVSSSPLTRSSHHAGEDFAKLQAARRALDAQGGARALASSRRHPGAALRARAAVHAGRGRGGLSAVRALDHRHAHLERPGRRPGLDRGRRGPGRVLVPAREVRHAGAARRGGPDGGRQPALRPVQAALEPVALLPHETGTTVEFVIDFAFKSKILDAMLAANLDRAANTLIGCFEDRARAIYGPKA